MGWLDGWWPGSSSSTDPLSSIDPKVRDFLKRESPVKYEAQAATKPAAPQPTAPPVVATSGTDTVVPKESLFQDGRYAHLWKDYRPQGEIESENKTDHEKLMDVLEGYKERKQNIGKAALENCALQQEEWISCMKNGDWEDRLQMCRKQVQRFERCYTMQTRLLKALGYQASLDRPAHVEEDIQMHADKLYMNMLEQEKIMKDAKEQGAAVPDLKDLFPRPANAIQPGPELRKSWDEKLAQLPVEQRATEEAALMADFQAKAVVAKDVQKLWDEQAEIRKARETQGQATMVDRVTNMFRFR